jgi:hypothetical protein
VDLLGDHALELDVVAEIALDPLVLDLVGEANSYVNLQPNPDFEGGQVAFDSHYWAYDWYGENTGCGLNSTTPHAGSWCYYITWDASTGTKGLMCYATERLWQPYRTYTVSFWARTASALSTPSGMAALWNVQPATAVWGLNPDLTTLWQRYAIRLTWGASVESSGRLFLSLASFVQNAGTLYMDDLRVEDGIVQGNSIDVIGGT